MTHASILITGAGIAGPALAYWLNRYGMKTTLVERAEELRTGGQNVDLRGGGREVARLMGLEDEVRARNTTEEGIHFVDEAGRTRASLPATAFGGEGLVAELEILRGELAVLLYERTRDDTDRVLRGAPAPLRHARPVAAPGLPRLANPKTRAGIAIEHALLRVATRPVISRLLGRLLSTSDKSITLPDYSHVGHAMSA
ncbi:FAD-dependent monooxygenase [Cystobacter fuscus]